MKNKFIPFLFSCLLTFSALGLSGQNDSLYAIPGSKCKIIPPAGFEAAQNFVGFQMPAVGASIMISEIPGNFKELVKGFTKEALQKAGMELIAQSEIDLNGNAAYLFEVSQMANDIKFIKRIVILGNNKETVMINGIYPESEKEVGDIIFKSIQSIHYNSKADANGQEAAPFTIDESNSGLKFSGYLSGALMYSADGKMPTNSPDKVVFSVGSSISNVTIDDKKAYSESRLKLLPRGASNEIKSVKEVTINGIFGYEIIAEGLDNKNEKQLVYVIMLYPTDSTYYIMVGMAGAKFEQYTTAFQKMANTFKVK
jgi:hypothetical protein